MSGVPLPSHCRPTSLVTAVRRLYRRTADDSRMGVRHPSPDRDGSRKNSWGRQDSPCGLRFRPGSQGIAPNHRLDVARDASKVGCGARPVRSGSGSAPLCLARLQGALSLRHGCGPGELPPGGDPAVSGRDCDKPNRTTCPSDRRPRSFGSATDDHASACTSCGEALSPIRVSHRVVNQPRLGRTELLMFTPGSSFTDETGER